MSYKCTFCNTHGSEATIKTHMYHDHKEQIDALIESNLIENTDKSDIKKHKYYNYKHDEIIKMPFWLESLVSDWNESENPICALIHHVNEMQRFQSKPFSNENMIMYQGNYYRKMDKKEEFPNRDKKIVGWGISQ